MTNSEKAQTILQATSQGSSLDKHHQLVLQAALHGELGDATRMIFDDLWEQCAGPREGDADESN